MNRCKTCAHWHTPVEGDHRGDDIVRPIDPDTYEPMKMPFEVRACRHPKLMFCERPVENPGFAVADGSTYFAGLYTSSEFGCVLHEPTTTRGEP
jgi:hypothetical protein